MQKKINLLPAHRLSRLFYKDELVSDIIMPDTGRIEVHYEGLTHFDGPIPSYSSLNTYFLNGDSLDTDLLVPRFPNYTANQINYYDTCIQNYTTRWKYIYSTTWEEVFYNIGYVNQGDQIELTYHSDIIGSGEEYYYEPYSIYELWLDSTTFYGWDVTFDQYDPCISSDLNYLWVIVRFKNDFELTASVQPDTLYPGVTANVIIKKRLPDGTLEDFDTTQTFEVAKLEGCVFGDILAADSLKSYFYGVHQPIKFLVDTSAAVMDTLVSDTGKVMLRVGLVDTTQMMKIKKNNFHLPRGQATDVTNCYTGRVYTENFDNAVALVENPLEIISPVPGDTNWISATPQMPDVICKARMKSYKSGTVKYQWKYWVIDTLKRRNKNNGQFYSLCPRISRSVFSGYSYATNNDTTNWTVPFRKDSGSFYFKAIWYKHDSNFNQPANGCDSSYTEYEGGNEVFTGGNISVKLIAYNMQGKKLAEDSISAGKLLGKNQNNMDSVYSYLNSNEVKAIMIKESKTKQFETGSTRYPKFEAGWPVYGYPNGYGIMQIDNRPAAVEEQLWNWKSNIDGGKSKFESSKTYSTTRMDNAIKDGATYVDSIYYMNAYQIYNGGWYWDWDKNHKVWKESTSKKSTNHYGREVYLIYKGLQ
jgi:hypothetical protein